MTNCETRYEKNYIFVICKVNDSMVVNVAVILLKVDSYHGVVTVLFHKGI